MSNRKKTKGRRIAQTLANTKYDSKKINRAKEELEKMETFQMYAKLNDMKEN